MSPHLARTLRYGGLSRRGFLRALGVTAASTLVPGLAAPGHAHPVLCWHAGTIYVGEQYWMTATEVARRLKDLKINGAFFDAVTNHINIVIADVIARQKSGDVPCP